MPRVGSRMVEHGLGCPGRVLLNSPRHQYGEHSVTPGDGLLDHLAVVGGPGKTVSCP